MREMRYCALRVSFGHVRRFANGLADFFAKTGVEREDVIADLL